MRATSVGRTVRRCRRRRQVRHRSLQQARTPVREEQVSEQGNRIDVAVLRAFLKRALEDDALADPVNELLFDHVVAGRYHPSVIAESLPSFIAEVLGTATREDWQAVADELIAEGREVDGEV
ncbi:MAG TPA: hypothetical protein VFN89_12245 [Solirubrobacterales bacterium]|nr:hypothetical protein [Solirubrobacterales bacterium]